MNISKTPLEFVSVLRELLIDPQVLINLGIDMASFAMLKVRQRDVAVIQLFLDDLLSQKYSHQDLEDWWASMPVGFHFSGGDGVKSFLNELRAEVAKPRLHP